MEMAEGEPPYMKYPQGKALLLISTQGAPPLKNPKQWSPHFQHFLSCCLKESPKDRISSIELLQVTNRCHRVLLFTPIGFSIHF